MAAPRNFQVAFNHFFVLFLSLLAGNAPSYLLMTVSMASLSVFCLELRVPAAQWSPRKEVK
jgi:hypothetical protein